MKSGFLIICCVIFSNLLTGQSFFASGVNYSVMSGRHFPFGKQKLENFKLTPSIGYGYHFKIKDRWSYQPGIYLGDLGSINVPDRPRTVFAVYAITLSQFVSYKPLNWLSFGISPSVNYNIYAGITGKNLHVDSNGTVYSEEKLINWKDASQSYKLNRFVVSIVPRVSFHLKNRWSMDLFYRSDLTPVGYPFRVLNAIYQGYGVGANLRYHLTSKKNS